MGRMMVLLPLIDKFSCRCVAVLGTVKNAGKTVTLNRLVAEAAAAGLALGVTSSGLDGERCDTLYGHPKPPVRLPAGVLVLTYSGLAGEAAGLLNVLQVLGRRPGCGDLLLARTEREGDFQLAGPITRRSMADGLQRLRRAGAGLVLVDGSVDRRGFVDPDCFDAIILATGMALGRDTWEVAEKTAFMAEILRLPVWPGALPAAGAFWLEGGWAVTGIKSALGEEDRLALAVPAGCSCLYLGGALTDRLLQSLMKAGKFPGLVLQTPMSCLVGRRAYQAYCLGGGRVWVRKRPVLLAVTINPWSRHGLAQPAALARAVKKVLGDVPVVDALRGLTL